MNGKIITIISGAYERCKAVQMRVKLQYHLLSNHTFSKTPKGEV